MNRPLNFAAALLLGLFSASADQTAKEPAKAPAKTPVKTPSAKMPPARIPAVKGGGGPKIPAKSIPVIRPIPGPQVQRFLRLTPQEREIQIDKLPIASQERMRLAAQRFDLLPPEERERQLKLFEAVSKLPKDKQDLVNQRIGEFGKLGPERKLGIRRAYHLLSSKSEEERRAIIDSPEFKDRFTPTEQQIVIDLVKYYPNPSM